MDMGADLVLLAIDDRRGEVRNGRHVALAVAAAELVEAAFIGSVSLSGGHLTVRGTDGVAKPDLVSALGKVAASRRPVTVAGWLAARAGLGRVRDLVLELELAGAVVVDDPSKSMVGEQPMEVHIADRSAARAAADRFVAVAHGTRTSAADEAFAALADAAGLTGLHLRGLSNRRARARISTLTAHRVNPPPEPDRTMLAIVRAAVSAMAEATRREGDSDAGGSMAIPMDKQFGMRSDVQSAWNI